MATSTQDEDELDDLLQSVGAGTAYLRIHRKLPEGGSSWVGNLESWSQDPLNDIRQLGGGGTFYVQPVRADGKLIAGRRIVVIEGPPRVPKVTVEPNDPQTPDTVAQSLKALQDTLREMRNPPPVAQQGNPLEMAGNLIVALVTAATPLIQLVRSSAPNDRDRGDSRDEREAYQQGIRDGFRYAGLAVPAADEGSQGILKGLLAAVGPTLAQGIPGVGQETHQEPPARPAPPPPAPSQEINRLPPAAEAPVAREPLWVTIARPHILALAPVARRQGDPALYGDLMVDQLQQTGGSMAVLEIVSEQWDRGDAFWAEFRLHFPDQLELEPWWRSLLERVCSTEEEEGEQEPEKAAPPEIKVSKKGGKAGGVSPDSAAQAG